MLRKYFSPPSQSSSKYAALPSSEIGHQFAREPRSHHSAIRWLFRWKIAAIGEFFVVVTLLLVIHSMNQRNRMPYSLVQDVITYEQRNFYNSARKDRTPYQGRPSPELDALWSGLYEGGIFKISKEEERLLPNRTSAIPGDTDHYVPSLSVFHNLHCLNFMRKAMWPEYYPQFDLRNATVFDNQEHCIDILRQAHMCNPDTTAAIWQWNTFDQESILTWDIQHTCVDYTKIQKWALSRALYEYDPKVYVEGNPIHQPAYHKP